MTDIDTPDLAAALAADTDGAFRARLAEYLAGWKAQVEQARNTGLSPQDYDAAGRLGKSLDHATKLLDFFATLNVLVTSGSKDAQP